MQKKAGRQAAVAQGQRSTKQDRQELEWSGVEWSGVERRGAEWSGVEWSGVEEWSPNKFWPLKERLAELMLADLDPHLEHCFENPDLVKRIKGEA